MVQHGPGALAGLAHLVAACAMVALPLACSDGAQPVDDQTDPNPGPPQVALGKRLFRETRFAQYFAGRAGGDMNRALDEGDPIVASVEMPGGPVAGPYRGQSINCASCHLSDELAGQGALGARAFTDFNPRSPLPDRGDGQRTTVRNAAALVDVLMPEAPGLFLHSDGEHATAEDLVVGSLTGRNFGWLPVNAPPRWRTWRTCSAAIWGGMPWPPASAGYPTGWCWPVAKLCRRPGACPKTFAWMSTRPRTSNWWPARPGSSAPTWPI